MGSQKKSSLQFLNDRLKVYSTFNVPQSKSKNE